MTTLIATSVVRGSHQGESHGGVYLVDFEQQSVNMVIDWNAPDIDWQGRGWDRGLRGIAFDGERVFIAASNELFVYSPDFQLLASYRNPYLMHCHEIAVYQRRLYLTSTGHDSILGFDLDENRFCFGLHLVRVGSSFQGAPFDPEGDNGPGKSNQLHINNVHCNAQGMHISGLKTAGVIRFNGRTVTRSVRLPQGVHNAQPYGDGVLFNDTASDKVRLVYPDRELSFDVPAIDPARLTHTTLDDSRIARAGFGRGLCDLGEGLIAAGCSPSTIAIHDLETVKTRSLVTLSYDIRNAIHGLEVWPY
ncbi:hypothetical protein GCM10007052_11540 [Halioglobus japonicus]|uniref:Uncharacterized protein n=1 Tax=Halioglobus japonicus TaxID=930805 RepID=A0AAP8MF70_9GAMM|nr:hypothetical protein [Halioglobus japonicus]PLW86682.1 hypothetical protein C0029_09830 [Halioglobus japonicus]GHD11597.1 hypothetical protein GCM10007052_11540 [Halioglobus japonicus]